MDSERLRRRYLKTLVAALKSSKRIKRSKTVSSRSREIKCESDLSLAMAVGGRSAWSGAIIKRDISSSRRCLTRKRLRSLCHAMTPRKRHGYGRCSSGRGVACRMEKLKSVVPGTKCLDTPDLLKECAEYVMALRLQVQAMQTLVDLCYDQHC